MTGGREEMYRRMARRMADLRGEKEEREERKGELVGCGNMEELKF